MRNEMLFEQVGEVVRGSAPRDLGEPRLQVRRTGVKVWYGGPQPVREHYEAQLIGADIVAEACTAALEIGFHAEHSREDDNIAVLAALQAHERRWRPELGDEAVPGAFLGRTTWRRISETWLDPDLDGADVAFEIGVRLVDYIRALEPHRRSAGAERGSGGPPDEQGQATAAKRGSPDPALRGSGGRPPDEQGQATAAER